jgi:hypothetical protein
MLHRHAPRPELTGSLCPVNREQVTVMTEYPEADWNWSAPDLEN